MRLPTILLAISILPATLASAWAQGQPFPYDPYPWCAVYGGRSGGASNCGFLTLAVMHGNGERHWRVL